MATDLGPISLGTVDYKVQLVPVGKFDGAPSVTIGAVSYPLPVDETGQHVAQLVFADRLKAAIDAFDRTMGGTS